MRILRGRHRHQEPCQDAKKITQLNVPLIKSWIRFPTSDCYCFYQTSVSAILKGIRVEKGTWLCNFFASDRLFPIRLHNFGAQNSPTFFPPRRPPAPPRNVCTLLKRIYLLLIIMLPLYYIKSIVICKDYMLIQYLYRDTGKESQDMLLFIFSQVLEQKE